MRICAYILWINLAKNSPCGWSRPDWKSTPLAVKALRYFLMEVGGRYFQTGWMFKLWAAHQNSQCLPFLSQSSPWPPSLGSLGWQRPPSSRGQPGKHSPRSRPDLVNILSYLRSGKTTTYLTFITDGAGLRLRGSRGGRFGPNCPRLARLSWIHGHHTLWPGIGPFPQPNFIGLHSVSTSANMYHLHTRAGELPRSASSHFVITIDKLLEPLSKLKLTKFYMIQLLKAAI